MLLHPVIPRATARVAAEMGIGLSGDLTRRAARLAAACSRARPSRSARSSSRGSTVRPSSPPDDRASRRRPAGRHPLPPGAARRARPPWRSARERGGEPGSTQIISVGPQRRGLRPQPGARRGARQRLVHGGLASAPAPRPDAAQLRALDELLGHPRAVAVGEIGLDLFFRPGYHDTPLDEQRRAMHTMLDLAAGARASLSSSTTATPTPRCSTSSARTRVCAASCTASAATRRSPDECVAAGLRHLLLRHRHLPAQRAAAAAAAARRRCTTTSSRPTRPSWRPSRTAAGPTCPGTSPPRQRGGEPAWCRRGDRASASTATATHGVFGLPGTAP